MYKGLLKAGILPVDGGAKLFKKIPVVRGAQENEPVPEARTTRNTGTDAGAGRVRTPDGDTDR